MGQPEACLVAYHTHTHNIDGCWSPIGFVVQLMTTFTSYMQRKSFSFDSTVVQDTQAEDLCHHMLPLYNIILLRAESREMEVIHI